MLFPVTITTTTQFFVEADDSTEADEIVTQLYSTDDGLIRHIDTYCQSVDAGNIGEPQEAINEDEFWIVRRRADGDLTIS